MSIHTDAERVPVTSEQGRELIVEQLRDEQVMSCRQLAALPSVRHMTIRREIVSSRLAAGTSDK
ncbi:hypothetical protein SCB71_20965 (plasmid) [Herbiconiux sp. KACC 21604]|uniref:hypothetical protein n=1 Tax=unclassified Herbiconiux TaxID=2618217 RepID=UPI001492B0EF|nr:MULTISPECIES: hypothetical protein [unclassified Herbiconiux]QJU56325.1 hypothetical protein HL652_21330 [Herbiconiux sp. SALV-R1]WPO88832.1 hypothetical protein SCB71_20965 [Herbiconiux sp. KACC 21604]